MGNAGICQTGLQWLLDTVQGYPSSPILLMAFIDRISRSSLCGESVHFRNSRIGSPWCGSLASIASDLQHALVYLEANCEVAMRHSISNSKAMVL